ncbi:hypothetical protein [Bordetella pertussis]|uniref:hypothetical protein n=1 Tax=Bordetella pertussis TaxID=520 RepID=UPI0039B529FF
MGGIDMPAGTRLSLEVAHSPDTYNRAEFPHPVSAHGLQALRIERYIALDHEPDTLQADRGLSAHHARDRSG